jgi:uncharacterized protein YecE (DUF72 family)
VPEVYAILRRHDAALVIGDHRERPFQTEAMTAGWTFVRFHYGRRGREGNYSAGELAGWARKIGRWRRERDVFVYFNNDWRGFAVDNALALAGALGVGPGARAVAARRTS